MASCEHPSQACEVTRRRVVLVVEDEALVRLTIADYLRDCGYVVAEAGASVANIKVLKDISPAPDGLLRCWAAWRSAAWLAACLVR